MFDESTRHSKEMPKLYGSLLRRYHVPTMLKLPQASLKIKKEGPQFHAENQDSIGQQPYQIRLKRHFVQNLPVAQGDLKMQPQINYTLIHFAEPTSVTTNLTIGRSACKAHTKRTNLATSSCVGQRDFRFWSGVTLRWTASVIPFCQDC